MVNITINNISITIFNKLIRTSYIITYRNSNMGCFISSTFKLQVKIHYKFISLSIVYNLWTLDDAPSNDRTLLIITDS